MCIVGGRRWIAAGMMAFFVGTASFGQPAKNAPPSTEVRPLDGRGLQDLVTHRNGRALVMNVWAAWCLPCVEEFPSLVRLDSLYRNREVDVVTLSIDFEDEVDGKVRPFLKRMRATMPSYVNAYPTPSDLIDAILKDWSGAIPATFFYDKHGSLVAHAVGQRSYEQLRELTEQALRSSARR